VKEELIYNVKTQKAKLEPLLREKKRIIAELKHINKAIRKRELNILYAVTELENYCQKATNTEETNK